MKVHNHSEQFDGTPHPVCGRGATAVCSDEFEATAPHLRCKLCERDWFPYGQPDWHLATSVQRQKGNLMSIEKFKFGTVTVPDGKRGPWRISSFTLTEDDVLLPNLRHIRDGNAYLCCPPGDYRRLTHRDRGVIMSNTPMEINTAEEAIRDARGNVLVNGLGLGMVIEAMLHKPSVTSITVVELDPDVIKLTGPHMKKLAKLHDVKLQIVQADAEAFEPPSGDTYDYVWHDIWDSIDDDNLPQMTRLVRKYKSISSKQGVWSREQARRLRAEMRRYA